MDRKKITIVISLIILILVGVALYLALSKKPTTPTNNGTFPGSGNPVASNAQIGNNDNNGFINIPFTPGSTTEVPRLYELHKVPVGGVSFAESIAVGNIGTPSVRYIERGLGHIYETLLSSLVETPISSETHSRISEALWGNNGKSVVIRYIDDKQIDMIQTLIINLGASANSPQSTSTPQNNFLKTTEISLPNYIPFMATSEDGVDKFFYLEDGPTVSAGTITSSKKVTSRIFTSDFTEWLPQFPNQNLVTLTTKPSSSVPGYLFFLNTKTKAVTEVLGAINGLTTKTSYNGKLVLFSEIINNVPQLSVYDIAKKEIRTLSMQTFPEKCAWSKKDLAVAYCAIPQSIPTAIYPDQWYQGLLSFSDDLWKINTNTGSIEKITSLPNLDIINPILSPSDNYFVFINKTTGTPWVYRITDVVLPPTAPVKNVSAAPTITTSSSASATDGMVKIK